MNSRAIADITNFIFMNDPLQSSDVILIPGNSRAEIGERAAQLYHAGLAPYILPSGKFAISRGRFVRDCTEDDPYGGAFTTEFEFMRHVLLTNGVPEDAVLREDRATNSMENAMLSAEVVRAMGLNAKRAIICCKAYHARRVFLSYACHFPNTQLLMAPVITQGITRENWFLSDKGTRTVMGELEKCGVYLADAFAGKDL